MKKENKLFVFGFVLLTLFLVWTLLVKTVDVCCIGPNGSYVGFATVNGMFHKLTGVNMDIYNITDMLGSIPFLVCLIFAFVGLIQWIKRKYILKVDLDIIILGIYYLIVIGAFFFFEAVPVNYRSVLIDGVLEVSYPSSTTLLVVAVMPTLVFQAGRRLSNKKIVLAIDIVTIVFSLFMVIGRLICGVHWLTDIIAGVILSTALFILYVASVKKWCK